MTRRNPPAKWVLPDVINPDNRLCFKIPVPDNPYHLAAFRGAMLQLASAYNWADDIGHTAKDVALVWRDIVDNHIESEECSTSSIMFNQSGDCTLSVSFDGGDTWTDIFNSLVCSQNAAIAAIQTAIDNGTIATPGQRPPGGGVTGGTCVTEKMNCQGNGKTIFPHPVQAKDVITISNARGGWYDGALIPIHWYCPSGDWYQLGVCEGGTSSTQSADPLPSVAHMKLVAHVGSHWIDAYDTTFTIPDDITDPTDLEFQANDSALSDNTGSITFDCELCNNHDAVGVSLVYASGPTGYLQYEHEYTYTSGHAFGVDIIELHFDRCINIEVTDLDGRMHDTAGGDQQWGYSDCSGTHHDVYTDPTTTTYNDVTKFGVNSSGAYTMKVVFHAI